MSKTRERCFSCGRVLGKGPRLVDTRNAQLVFVGRECAKLIDASGEAGYQPPRGGLRLYVLDESTADPWMLETARKYLES